MTFFALLGLVVVEAVQNSPCWLKVGRKGVFRACRESFVPGGPDGAACWESFVPGDPSGLRAGRVLYRHRPRVRYKVLPAWLVIGVSVKRFSLRAESGPKSAFLCVRGEFCTGWARRVRVLAEFCTGGGFVAWC